VGIEWDAGGIILDTKTCSEVTQGGRESVQVRAFGRGADVDIDRGMTGVVEAAAMPPMTTNRTSWSSKTRQIAAA
jgi:hypothetical protein